MGELKTEFEVLVNANTTIPDKHIMFNRFITSLKMHMGDGNSIQELTNLVHSVSSPNEIAKEYRISLVMEFLDHDLVLNELMFGDDSSLVVARLLKNRKLLKDIFQETNSNILTNEVLPSISYILKLKLLNGISLYLDNENLLNSYFEDLEKKYGFEIASIVLPGCSMEVITSAITKYYITLSNKQLIRIFIKDHTFIEFYFNIKKSKEEDFDFDYYSFALKRVASIDLPLYLQLQQKYKFRPKFGRHLTKRILQSDPGFRIDDVNVFHERTVYKELKKGRRLNHFLINMCPESHLNFKSVILCGSTMAFLTTMLKKGELVNLMRNVFHEKYGLSLFDFPEYFTDEFFLCIPDAERESILDTVISKNENLLPLYPLHYTSNRLKREINQARNAFDQCTLLLRMYETCLLHRDRFSLIGLLDYIHFAHTGNVHFLETFLCDFQKWPNVVELGPNYWWYIASFIEVVEASNRKYFNEKLQVKFMCHLIENNRMIELVMRKYILKRYSNNATPDFTFSEDRKYQKRFVEEIGKALHFFEIFQNYQSMCVKFLVFLVSHNSSCKRDKINFYDYKPLFQHIKSNGCEDSVQIIRYGLKNHCNDDFWHKLFWKQSQSSVNFEILSWYTKKGPRHVKDNVGQLLTFLSLDKIDLFIKKVKRYLDVDTVEAIKFYVFAMIHSKSYEIAIISVRIIAVLASELFLEVVRRHLPNPDVEYTNRETTFHNSLIRHLSKESNIENSLLKILEYLNTRYYKIALSPLYSVMYNVQEMNVQNYLTQISNGQLSARKHSIFLAGRLLPSEDFIEILRGSFLREIDSTMKTILLKKSIGHLSVTGSELLWNLFRLDFGKITLTTANIVDFFLRIEKIPDKYLPKYVEIMYEKLSGSPFPDINGKKYQLINSIPMQIVNKLNRNLLKLIIRDSACEDITTEFHWRCVFYANPNLQRELMLENFGVLRIFIEEHRHDLLMNNINRGIISSFLRKFINLAIDLKENIQLITEFITYWCTFPIADYFLDDITMMHFTKLYFESDFVPYEFGVKVNIFLGVFEKFHSSLVDAFTNNLREFLDSVSIVGRDLFTFTDGLFSDKTDENTYIVTIKMLPKHLSKFESFKSTYENILMQIERCQIPVVKFHYGLYLSGINKK